MIKIGHNQLAELERRVKAAEHKDLAPMLDAIGQTIEDNARRRIRESKRTPAGKRWKQWSEKYAETREPQHSLLVGEGNLADSLDHQLSGDSVLVGSNLEYAAVHQWGSEDGTTPVRPYLSGESFDDETEREELRDVIRKYLGNLL